MTGLSRRRFTFGLCGCTLGLAGCVAQTDDGRPITQISNMAPGQKPVANDEAGLWQSVDKLEERMKRSPERIRDPSVTALIQDMACQLAGNHCPDLRSYVMRIPQFNASMYPTGMMQVWTGLLLRCENEAQLAAVIGHEFGHYLRRHSLQRFRDVRAKADLAVFLGIGMAVAGLPPGFSDMTNLMITASISGFSRDNEREADMIGLDVMADAGYDPFEAQKIWERLIKEAETAGDSLNGNLFTATHPDPDERVEKLSAAAKKRGRPAQTRPDRLREAIAPIRTGLLLDEVALGRFKRSMALFDILEADGYRVGEVLFAKAELHRKRADKDDEGKALDLYGRAFADASCPPEAHRSAGLLHYKAGRKDPAQTHLRAYLQARPDAVDRNLVTSYIGSF